MASRLRPFLPALLVLSIQGMAPGADHRPDLAVFARSISGDAPPAWLLEFVRSGLEESGRFDVVLPETIGIPDDSSLVDPAMLRQLAVELGIDVYVAVGVRPLRTSELTRLEGDTLVAYQQSELTVAAWFYSGGGALMGTVEKSASSVLPLPASPSLDALAEQAAREVIRESLMEVFPVEVHFVASGGALQTLPAGGEIGLRKGMALSVVASATGFPDDPEQYAGLRSHGILQITEVGERTSTGRLLSGLLVPGGDVVAIEQSKPVLISLAYDAVPIEVEPGSGLGDPEDLDRNRLLNRLRLDIGSCGWGLNFGGAAVFGVADHLSTLGLCLTGGYRLPISSPGVSLRLGAGADVSFMMQEVRDPYLSSNANAITVGAIGDATLELLPWDHLGLLASVGGYLGTSAGSWDLTDEYGSPRDAEPDEVYFTELRRSPVRFGAGFFYLIY